MVSPAGTGLIYITGSSRVSYGLSRNGYVPSAFEATNRSGVPWVGLIAAFVVGCVLPAVPELALARGADHQRQRADVRRCALSFGVFRRRLPNVDRPYRLPGGGWMSPLAFVVANFLILWSGWTTDWKLGIAILIGYVVLIANRVFRMNPVTPQLDLRAAQWLPAYLVGMGLVVYASDFGPSGIRGSPCGGTWRRSQSSASPSITGPWRLPSPRNGSSAWSTRWSSRSRPRCTEYEERGVGELLPCAFLISARTWAR